MEFIITAEHLALVDSNGDTQLFKGRHTLQAWQGNGLPVTRDFDVETTQVIRRLHWD